MSNRNNIPFTQGELEMPRFVREGYKCVDDNGEWCLKDNAPEWAKKEFEEFFRKLKCEPDENGAVKQY